MSTQQLTYDSSDTSVFVYTGSWLVDGQWASSNGESGTLATSNDPNGYVTFKFPSAAVSFTYYGIKRSRGGLYGVCTDCDINSSSFGTIDAFDASDNGQNPPIALYSTSWAQPGVHTVIIKNEADSRGTPTGNSQLTLDRVVIDVLVPTSTSTTTSQAPTPKPQVTTSASISSTTTTQNTTTSGAGSSTTSLSTTGNGINTTGSSNSGSGSSSSSSTQTGGQIVASTSQSSSDSGVPLAANTGSPNSASSSPSHIGTIIGPIVGSLAVIALILFLVLCFRRHRRKNSAILQNTAIPDTCSPPPMGHVEPFVLSTRPDPSSTSTSTSTPASVGAGTVPPLSLPVVKTSGSSMEKKHSLIHRRLQSNPSQASSSVLDSSIPPSTAPESERDAGSISFSLSPAHEDQPPQYSQIYS
ncbi:hypothetical protein BDN70DRAFT_882687 [Pholiota conissans]|uniref:Uncharacterized protein n=1 Tax=Pholiota conissans TaxID=109636 RepID=A0A9P5YUV0_9AGAR|nr:hypothetical protein BDN70DRAFT_882687 [Pholiota conissans]